MDIWAWVETVSEELHAAGQSRIANMLYSIPSDVNESRISQVEAALPEALAAARAMKNPWLELFFRHWGLSSRLSNLCEGATALPEAVSLIEFAHRDETIACPQSICATHDIAICYGNTDGPGWVSERMEVCAETLARMEPARQCYDCLSREYASALRDGNRAQEAVTFLAEQAEKMGEAGNKLSVAYKEAQARSLHDMGRFTEALALLQRITEDHVEDDEESDLISRAVLRARVLIALERFDEAWEILPNWSDIVPLSYDGWTFAMAELSMRREGENIWQLGRVFQEAVDHMLRVGSYRMALDIALRHGYLAVARGAAWTARRALTTAKSAQAELRADLGASAQIAALEAKVATLPINVTLPVPAEELLAYLQKQESQDPEKDIDFLLAASKERPDDQDIAETTASAMRVCYAKGEAQSYLWAFVKAHPDLGNGPVIDLLNLLLETDQAASLQSLIELVEPHQEGLPHWIRARIAFKNEHWSEVGGHIQKYIHVYPQALGARRLWAEAEMKAQNFATAVQVLTESVAIQKEQKSENKNDHWDLMSAASAAQDWKTVRHTAKDMGFKLSAAEDENEPIEEEAGWVRLRYWEDGQWLEYFGMRTGPVTARVLSVVAPRRIQHFKDWVVFDASPLEKEPEDEKEKEAFITPYKVIHTLESGQYKSWFIDGASPSKEVYETLRSALQAKDWGIWKHSATDYTVTNPKDIEGENLLGLYFCIATPSHVTAKEADAILAELTESWEHPMCWLALAEAAGSDVERHKKIIEQYGL